MNFKLKFSLFLFVAFFAASCNSNKKKVESDGKDYSNFNRVGAVDTMQDKEVLPGNIKSINDYVATTNKGLRNEMRNANEGNNSISYILGGKGSYFLKASKKSSGLVNSSIDFFYKNNALIFAESKEMNGAQTVVTRYYFDNAMLSSTLKGVQGETKSENGLNFETVKNESGKEAELKAIEAQLKAEFLNISPFKAKVVKKGDKYSATTCFDGKEYTLEDKNGYLGKAFKDHEISDGKFMLVNLKATKNEETKTMIVSSGDFMAAENGVVDCF